MAGPSASPTAQRPPVATPPEATNWTPAADSDFIPLVIPPPPRGRWSSIRGAGTGRLVAAALLALLLLGIIGAAAWLALGMGASDGHDGTPWGSDTPALVAGATPRAATPSARSVARNNTKMAASPAVTLDPPPGAGSSPSPAPFDVGQASATPARAPTVTSLASPTVGLARVSRPIDPTATPPPTAAVTSARPSLAATFPDRPADALATMAGAIERPTPAGDGTGGVQLPDPAD